MTLLRYYKSVNSTASNSKDKDELAEKDKSESEEKLEDLSEASTEEEIDNDETDETSVSLPQKRKTLKSHIFKKKTKVKVKKVFQRKWLREFSWLRYDSKEKRMHCELCRFHNINIPFAKEGKLFYFFKINKSNHSINLNNLL